MGIRQIYFNYTGDLAKDVHRKYNSTMLKINDTRIGGILSHFNMETDPFQENR